MVRTANLRKRRGEKLADWETAQKRVREGPNRRTGEETAGAIRAYYDSDAELCVASLVVSLICPILNKRVTEAARSVNCTHFQCFDVGNFLRMQAQTPNWDCPFTTCSKEILLEDLVIDEYFNGVLQETEDTVSKVELLPNGTWQPVEGADSRAAAVAPAIDVEEIQIVDDENTSGDKKSPTASVPVAVLQELHAKNKDVFHQLNRLGYKRLGGVADCLMEMNAFIKQQICQAFEAQRSVEKDSEDVSSQRVATKTRKCILNDDILADAFKFLDRLRLEKLQYCCRRYRTLVDEKLAGCCFRIISRAEITNGFSRAYRLTAALRIPGYDESFSFSVLDSDSHGNRLLVCAEIGRDAHAKRSGSVIFRNAVVEALYVKDLTLNYNLPSAFGLSGLREVRCRCLYLERLFVRTSTCSFGSLHQLIESFDSLDEFSARDFSFPLSPYMAIKTLGDRILSICAENCLKNFEFFHEDNRQETFSEEVIMRFLFGRRAKLATALRLNIGSAQWASPEFMEHLIMKCRDSSGRHKVLFIMENANTQLVIEALKQTADSVDLDHYGGYTFVLNAASSSVEVYIKDSGFFRLMRKPIS